MKLVEGDIVNVYEMYLQGLVTKAGVHDDEIHQNMATSLDCDGDGRGIDSEQVQAKSQPLARLNNNWTDLELFQLSLLV